MKKLTTKSFIKKANDKHNGIYSYDKTVYVKSNVPIIITCQKHGDFSQQPNNHLFGNGCPKCGNEVFSNSRTSNTEQFIEKANKIHQHKFEYSKTIYKRWNIDVTIICKAHGEFKQRPNNHLNGSGCPVCAENFRQEKFLARRLTNDEFIERASKIHNNKYFYNTPYINAKTSIIITCSIHGNFTQNPFGHLSGKGCRKCGFIVNEPRRTVTTDEFIQKAKEIHGSQYSYEKFVYLSNNSKSIIICAKHGDFKQSGASHLRGSGCPQCKESRGEKAICALLKELEVSHERQYKIEECKNKYKLPFDFAIFYKNKLCGLIEYQGKQHFYPIKCWGGNETLQYVQNNDRIKKQYCIDNCIPFITISYKDNLYRRVYEFIEKVHL